MIKVSFHFYCCFLGRNRDEVREEFLAELTQVVLEKASCKVVHLDVKDFADAAWMLRTETGDPFLLFVDGKSSRINMVGKGHLPPSTQPCQMTDLPGNGKQASRLLNIASMTETLANVREGSMADALKKGRYLFVYMNTGRPSQTFGVGNKILHIGGNDAKSFLSFCEEFYYLNRLST